MQTDGHRSGRLSQPRAYQGSELSLQLEIHRRALELRKDGLSLGETVERILNEYGVKVCKKSVSYWARNLHNPMGRVRPFEPHPTKELAYIIGVEIGDGSLNENKKVHTYRIRLQSVDKEFVVEFGRCLAKVLNTPRHALWSGAGRREIHVAASSRLLYDFLRKPLGELRTFIEHCVECTAAFLRGFFDSEGCVEGQGSLKASNSEIPILKYVQRLLLERFGIESTGPYLQTRRGTTMIRRGREYTRRVDCFSIRIRNKFRSRFMGEIGFSIHRKEMRLREILRTGKAALPYRR